MKGALLETPMHSFLIWCEKGTRSHVLKPELELSSRHATLLRVQVRPNIKKLFYDTKKKIFMQFKSVCVLCVVA